MPSVKIILSAQGMHTSPPKDLPVLHLGSPRPPWRLTPRAAQTWADAAAVCLEKVGHDVHVEMSVTGFDRATRVIVQAPAVDDAMRRTHRNLKDAVEFGAQAVVASLIHEFTDLVFIDQAFDHTGVDFWLASRSESGPFFQAKARLEISGILRETPSNSVEYRLTKKAERLDKYPSEYPASIAVVEFSQPRTEMRHHD